MNIAIIMAGGTGSRMGGGSVSRTSGDGESRMGGTAALPKQFMEIGKGACAKPIIMHTLSKFLESGCFDAIYIGMHPDWVEYMGDLLAGGPASTVEGASTTSKPDYDVPPGGLHIISGGNDRNSTLLNVLAAVESDLRDVITSDTAHDAKDNPNIDEYDPIIVTHDAVRPFVTVEMIEQSIDAARMYGAATVAIPTVDTVAVSGDTTAPLSIRSIPDRSTLYNVQTPQSFKLSAFREAYSSLTNDKIPTLTDVCGIFTAAGRSVAIVQGDSSNIKITTPFDLRLAELLKK